MALKIHPEFRRAAAAARLAGWVISSTGKTHLKWQSPAGRTIYTPSTPSSMRGIKKDLVRLRKAGLPI